MKSMIYAIALTLLSFQTVNTSQVQVYQIIPIEGISVADVDIEDGDMKITISVSKGLLTLPNRENITFISGNGIDNKTLSFFGKINDVNNTLSLIEYSILPGTSGIDTLTLVADDQGNTGAGGPKKDTKTITINLPTTNAPPVVVTPSQQSTNEDVPKAISGIRISDSDVKDGNLKVYMNAGNGRITLKQITGLEFLDSTGNGESTLMFMGKLTSVSMAVSTITYTPSPNFNGMDLVRISVNDQGNTGDGGERITNAEFNVLVAAVNDAPTFIIPSMTITPRPAA